jgi:ferritin-like metal-binding protein YciE
MKIESLRDVFDEQIADLYDAENQLVGALPELAQKASTGQLREAFETHLEETRNHVKRLEELRNQTGITERTRCEAMAGLIKEGSEITKATGDPAAIDAALIAAAQRVEHYEIAGYGTARTLADELGLDDAETLLSETLAEESKADELLTKIATGGFMKSGVNRKATSAA